MKLEILRVLEEDSASTLHLARDKKNDAECALRRFKTTKQDEIEGLQELYGQVAKLEHPSLERVLDLGSDKDGFYLVTPLPEGETLEQVLERGPLTSDEFEVVATQLLAVLDVLHEQAVVHGSLRPDYIRLVGSGAKDWRVILSGFGQGFSTRTESKEEQIRAYRCTAPEQWQDGTTRRRTDVYALGCVLYEALTARAPFDGRTIKELRLKHVGHDLPPLRKLASQVPPWVCAWVMHLLAADPEQRPRKAASARELYERREPPMLPELPPRSEVPQGPIVPHSTPAVMLAAAAPVVPETPAAAAAPASPESTRVPAPAIPAAAQAVSAPVRLPAGHALARNVTSATIPISSAPRSVGTARPGTGSVPGGMAPRRPSANLPTPAGAPAAGSGAPRSPAPARPSSAARTPAPKVAPRKPPGSSYLSLDFIPAQYRPYALGAGAVLVLFLLFSLTRCGSDKTPPASGKAGTKQRS